MTDLMIIENLPTPAVVYASGGAEDLLNKIEKEARSFTPDISTEKGRKEIASLAYKIAKAKTALDAMGKDLTEDWKKQSKAVDQERSRIRDRLDNLKEEIRAPLTAFEEKEKKRVETLSGLVEMIETYHQFPEDYTSGDIQKRIDSLKDFESETDFMEFKDRANFMRDKSLSALQVKFDQKLKSEVDAQRLADLEAAEKKRAAEEAETQRIAAENARIEAAKEEARIEAERVAKEEADRVAAAAQAEKERMEKEKQDAIDAARIAAEKSAVDKIAAQQKADKEKSDAVENERKRQADEKSAEEEATRKREANLEHKRKINGEAWSALALIPFENKEVDGYDFLKEIIKAISKGEIPHVSIKY